MGSTKRPHFSVKGIAFVLAVVTSTAFVVYYFAFAANTTIGNNISTSGTLTVGSASVLSSTLLVSGAVNASSTLQVTGDTHLYGNLTVDGVTNFAGFISNSSSTISSNLLISGILNASSSLSVTGRGYFGSNVGIGTTSPSQLLGVQGNLFLSGNISNVANITATGTLTVSGTASSSIATALGIASTSPWGTFSVEMGINNPAFVVSNNGSSSPSLFIGGVNQNGNVGIGTSTPSEALSVAGNISNISSPNFGPKLNSSITLPSGSNPQSVFVFGRYAYVVQQGTSLLQIFDISTSSPAVVGSVTTKTKPDSVYVAGNYAYVVNFANALNSQFLEIFDVSNPSAPVKVGSIALDLNGTQAWNGTFVQVSGKFAYVVTDTGNVNDTFQVFNVSSPSNPIRTASVSLKVGDNPYFLQVIGKYAYVSNDGNNSLDIFDISTSTPALVGAVTTGASPGRVQVSGRYAYLAECGASDVRIFDVSNPASPQSIKTVATGSGSSCPWSISLSGRYLYVLNDDLSGTLQVFDVADPYSPASLTSTNVGTGPIYSFISGRNLYIADGDPSVGAITSQLRVYDVSGLETTAATIHSLEAGNLQVRNDALISGQLSVGSALNVGLGGIFSNGPLAIMGSLGVGTTSTFTQGLTVQGNTSISGNILAANITATGTLGIGTTTLNNNALAVVGSISNLADTNSNPVLISSQGTGVKPSVVSVFGRYAYVVNQTSDTLQLFDISTSTPALVSTVTTGIEPNSVFASGRYAYVVNGHPSNSLQIFDTANPSNLSLVGSSTVNKGAADVFVSGRRVFVISTTTPSLQIIDASNPQNAVMTGSAATDQSIAGERPTSVFVSGRYAYVTNDNLVSGGSLQIFDISTSTPALIGSLNTGEGRDVYVSGSIAYVVVDNQFPIVDGLLEINVSNPANPVNIGSSSDMSSGTNPQSVYVSGRYAFIGTSGGLSVYDTLNPGTAVGSLSLTGANSVQVSGRYAYITRASGQNLLSVVDVTGLETTSAIIHSLEAGNLQVRNSVLVGGQLQVGDSLNVGFGGIFSDGPLAINATTSKSVIVGGLIIGTSTPATTSPNFGQFQQSTVVIEATSSGSVPLTVRGSGSQLANLFQIQTSDNTNQLVVSSGGLLGVSSSTPWGTLSVEMGTNNPAFVVSNNGSSSPSLFIGGVNQNGYVGIGTSSPSEALSVAGNISNIFANSGADSFPRLRGSANTGVSPYAIYVSGRYAYVVNQSSNTLQIFDVSTSSPALVGSATTGSAPTSVYVSGRYAYVVSRNPTNTLQIFDISNPASPVSVGTANTGNDPFSVSVSGRYAYVINQVAKTLQIFDVSNPVGPISVGTANTGTDPNSIYVSGRYAYVVNETSKTLQVFDVSNPASPISVGTASTRDTPVSVYVSGRYAYVVNKNDNTLQVFDVSNASSPVSIGFATTGSIPISVFVSGRYAYVVNEFANTLQVFDVSASSTPVLVGTATTGSLPLSVFVSGRYAYVVNLGANNLQVFDISGLETTSANIHSLEAGNLQVRNDILAQGQLQVAGGVNVGAGGILSSGPLGISATTSSSVIFGGLGIGTSTPGAAFAVQGNALISGTTTSGVLVATGTIQVQGAATSTFTGNGINLLSGCFAVNGNCVSGSGGVQLSDTNVWTGLNTFSLGLISTASSTFSNTLQVAGQLYASSTLSVASLASLNNGFIASGSSTISNALQIAGNLQASSTVSANALFVVGNTGVGTTSPAQRFSVQGNAFFSGNLTNVANITATGSISIGSSTPFARLSIQATSSSDITPLISVGSTSPNTNFFQIDTTGSTTISNLVIGSFVFDTNAGMNTLADEPITSDAAVGTVEGYKFNLDASTTLVVYGESDGNGGVKNQRIGIATATPMATLSVVGNIALNGCMTSATTTVDLGSDSCLDVAEIYRAGEQLQPGDVVALDPANPLYLIKAFAAASTSANSVIGVISTSPAILFENNLASFGGSGVLQDFYAFGDKIPLALTGRIPTKVNLEGGAIKIGDPIAASSVPGEGKKAGQSGKIIGYALTDYAGIDDQNHGRILLFANLSYWSAPEAGGSSLLDSVIATVKSWLESLGVFIENGLVTLKDLVADQITVKKLCVEDTCIDKTQFQALLQNAGNPAPANNSSTTPAQ